jgi:hypothetical protein
VLQDSDRIQKITRLGDSYTILAFLPELGIKSAVVVCGKSRSLCAVFPSGILEHMKNKQKNEGNVPGGSQGKKDATSSLPRMEMYAVLGLELGQKIFEKLQKVEESVEILARQKARELNPDISNAEAEQ